MNEAGDFGKYLSLPSFIERNRNGIFAFVE